MSSSAIYLSSDDEKSSSRQSVPKLKGSENFIFWDLAIRTYLGSKCTASIERPRPVIDEHKLRQIQRDLSGTTTYKKDIASQQKAWDTHQERAFKALVLASAENTSAQLICVGAKNSNKTAGELFALLTSKFHDSTATTLTHQLGTLNQMTAKPGEKRSSWIDRLLKQVLTLESIGSTVTEAHRVERLLNGLVGNPAFEQDAKTLEVLPDKSWDSLTAQLIAWENRQEQKGKLHETANHLTTIKCHECNEFGHKRPDCPLRVNNPPDRRRKFSKGSGGRNGNSQWRGGKGGRGGGGKKGDGHRTKNCNLCGKPGHYANDCKHASDFQAFLKTKKRRGRQDDDSESSNMLQELEIDHSLLSLVPTDKFQAALDSGTSSHAIKASCLPKNVNVDRSKARPVGTAGTEVMLSQGAADAGSSSESW